MTDIKAPDDSVIPRLVRGVRLRADATRGGHVLLAPERIVTANPTAVAVIERCDGERTLGAILDDLAATYQAERELIARDVRAMLADLSAKRLVEW